MNDTTKWATYDLLKVLDVIHAGQHHERFAQIAEGLGLALPAIATPAPDPAPDREDEAAGEPPDRVPSGDADNEARGGPEDDPTGIMLLADIRGIFAAKGVDRISSEDLCNALAGMPNRPWSTKSQGRPITAVQLAWLLRRFDIRPTTVWLPEKPLKGYHLDAFAGAFPGLAPSCSVRS